MKVTILHNPRSGYDQIKKEYLISKLKAIGYQKIIYKSIKKDKYKKALKDIGDLLVIAGGDGTIGKAARNIKDFAPSVIVLPLGTANNIAKTFHLMGNPEDLISNFKKLNHKRLDIGEASGLWGKKRFIESVGLGLFGHMIIAGERLKKLKHEGYDSRSEEIDRDLKILTKVVESYQPQYFRINIDGEDFSGDYLMVEVMNTPYIGPNLSLASNVNPGDGFFDVVLMKEQDRKNLGNYLEQRLYGKQADLNLTTIRGKKILLGNASKDFHIDDKIKNLKNHSEISIRPIPRNLKILFNGKDD